MTHPDPGADESNPALPKLTDPVLVAAFEGWNDAGDAASAAIEHLQLSWDASPLTELDPEEYYDFTVTRPTLSLVDGVTRRVEWPTTRFTVCRPPGVSHDVVLLHGIEPNIRWRRFCAELVSVIERLGISTVVTMGSLLADTAHTRPVPVTGTAYDAESASRFGLDRSRYEGATGVLGVFHDYCVRAGIPAVSFWAAVPHYVSQPPSPKTTLALLRRVEDALDIEVPVGTLPEQSAEWEETVSEMADEDEDVKNYVRALEERGDEITLTEANGEVIAAEFERYLQRRHRGGWGGPSKGG
ncbi:PAC2 family protein [Actinoalloteichus sp. AHMU CJ021]|uniref:Proteasome assembly chaperone (PAC2) family protein n=1 Tax=Actinoalloteichus caeruleus DSM 43889 TaxID=1120930 RepID=A0ABT1JC03_ACTCY|nr:PAC2 family protein [Actinoalloteichus caeruleus]AUS80648.1 PAC2 family protein [Actinoalloteichus sp. AHMU CJ021]MCP2330032.1 Proteasome assembly chaperone (PAC2) family protein [Actinoalloteichus caeruleus DSM 43889]